MNQFGFIFVFAVGYVVVAWAMYQAGRWRRDWPGWSWNLAERYRRQIEVERNKRACLEADLEEMESQRDQLAAYADQLEAQLRNLKP